LEVWAVSASTPPEGVKRQFVLEDTLDPETNELVDWFVDNTVIKYYKAQYGSYVSQLPGQEPNNLQLTPEAGEEVEGFEGVEGGQQQGEEQQDEEQEGAA
jgi:hypothetical protein